MDKVIFNTHDVVLLMTAYQCILFAVLLLTIKRENRLRNVLLALFLLQHAAIPLDILISFGAEFRHIALDYSPNLFYMFGFGYWLEGPLLLWYTRSLVYKDYSLGRRDLVYLIPVIAYLVHQILFYYSLDFFQKKSIQETYDLFVAPQHMNYVTLFRDIFRAALGVMCLMEIQKYRRHLKHNYSAIEKLDLTWLTLLVSGFLAIRLWAVMVAFMIILSVAYGIRTDFETMGLLGNYTTFILVSLLIFFSLGHSTVCEGLETRESDNEPASESDGESLPKSRKSQNKEESDKHRADLAETLAELMKTEKPYLIPELTLEKLSLIAGMSPRALSGIINRQFNCNFFEFVNSYRVEQVKEHLADPSYANRSVLDIMYDVGFNSKATFNTLFKKKVGMTPSEYRKFVANKPEEHLTDPA